MDEETRVALAEMEKRLRRLEAIVFAPVDEIDPIERQHQEFAAECRARQEEV